MQNPSAEIVTTMTDLIGAVLGPAAWTAGLLVLALMAAMPLLESLGTPGGRR